MKTILAGFELVPIASTDDRFLDFAPYVASINQDGIVAFQAGLAGGASGVFFGSGGGIGTVLESTGSPVARVISHPAINRQMQISFYGENAAGESGLWLFEGGQLSNLTACNPDLVEIGPLGPTMNEAGQVALRARSRDGAHGVYLAARAGVRQLARSGADHSEYSEFHGLPVVNNAGAVLFRADRVDGRAGLYRADAAQVAPHDATQVTALLETGAGFVSLAPFPMMNDAGAVLFGATAQTGQAGIFCLARGQVSTLVDTAAGFESVRGALINPGGMVVFYATPVGGQLGVYHQPQGRAGRVERILGIGDTLFGAQIQGFALNPVSVNDAGQIALRIALDNGMQWIVRADPLAQAS
jgi:hypothetical protein